MPPLLRGCGPSVDPPRQRYPEVPTPSRRFSQSLFQEGEHGQHAGRTDLLPVAGQRQALDEDSPGPAGAHEHGAHRLPVGGVGAGHPGRRQPHGAAQDRPDAGGQLGRHGLADRALPGQQVTVDAEQLGLDLARIGHDPTTHHGRRPGHAGQRGADQAAGQRLGGADGQAALDEHRHEARGERPGIRRRRCGAHGLRLTARGAAAWLPRPVRPARPAARARPACGPLARWCVAAGSPGGGSRCRSRP